MTSSFVLDLFKTFLFFLFFTFCRGEALAQVVTTVDSYPVINLNNLAPLGCVLTSSEASFRRAQMSTQTPSNDALLGVGSAVSNHNGTWNSKMSIKYQLMCADHSTQPTDWATAYILCEQYSGEGGSAGEWRLPTQREFLIITALHPQLREISGFTPFSINYYWCSTEFYATGAWLVYFKNGRVGFSPKIHPNRVRCVRDL